MTNKSILAVLKTKATELENGKVSQAKAKHIESVIEMGFEIEVRENSSQGYVTIKNEETGRNLVISKGYDGYSYLYGNGRAFDAGFEMSFNEFTKCFDFFGYLTKPNQEQPHNPHQFENSRVDQLKRAKQNIDFAEKQIEEYREKMAEMQRMVDYYESKIKNDEAKVQSIMEKGRN